MSDPILRMPLFSNLFVCVKCYFRHLQKHSCRNEHWHLFNHDHHSLCCDACIFFFRYLIKFLARLAENSDINKMTAVNLAIVIAPSLLWPPFSDDKPPSTKWVSFYCMVPCIALLLTSFTLINQSITKCVHGAVIQCHLRRWYRDSGWQWSAKSALKEMSHKSENSCPSDSLFLVSCVQPPAQNSYWKP